jgi:hypothetical protein
LECLIQRDIYCQPKFPALILMQWYAITWTREWHDYRGESKFW